ncbi:hypothetical protein F4678DRAFT_318818 [Xylaria arbuscula]|nr:hypothetical protein F4678DRAFT_318818 [Xylaria arbuscula]
MPAGYPRLASLMGAHPEMTAFRRFGSLNALNLLYLQADLIGLENELQKQAEIDAASGHFENSIYDRDWRTLSESAKTEGGGSTQWHTVLKVRDKLKEYNQAICLQQIIAKLGAPSEQDFTSLQQWMKDPSMGNVYLLGADSDVWETFNASELVCLKPNKSDSLVTRFLTNKIVTSYHYIVGHHFRKPDALDIHQNTVYYSQNGIIRLSMLFGTVLASVLLVGSIVILYSLRTMPTRLTLIGVFTAMFSLGLGIFTNGRIIEIFSATAAFAAVQVVFVSGTSSAG